MNKKFDFNNFEQIPIKSGVCVKDWLLGKESLNKVLIGNNYTREKDKKSSIDVYAVLTMDEYVNNVRDVDWETRYKWNVYGGRGVTSFLSVYIGKYENIKK